MKEIIKNPDILAIEEKFDVEFEMSYDGESIYHVQFNFPDEVWLDIANKDGDLLPICCGDISAIRDQFIAALRDDRSMDASSLQAVAMNAVGHEFADGHPVRLICDLYKEIKDKLTIRTDLLSTDTNNIEDVIHHVAMNKIWEFASNELWDKCSADTNIKYCSSRNRKLYELFPFVKTLYEKLLSTGYNPVEGYALVRLANNEIIEVKRNTLGIWAEKEDAEDMLEQMIECNYLKVHEVEIKIVRVSVENGIEFIESIKNPFLGDSLPSKIDDEQYSDLWRKINELRTKNDNSFKNDRVEVILLDTIDKLKALKDYEKS